MGKTGWHRPVKDTGNTYRYQVADGGEVVFWGITTDLAAARAQCRERWPTGRFAQVGETMTEAEARLWLTANGGTVR